MITGPTRSPNASRTPDKTVAIGETSQEGASLSPFDTLNSDLIQSLPCASGEDVASSILPRGTLPIIFETNTRRNIVSQDLFHFYDFMIYRYFYGIHRIISLSVIARIHVGKR